jgi:capping protein alpha
LVKSTIQPTFGKYKGKTSSRNGRWKAQWTYHFKDNEFHGQINVHIHYYEDGNVQLKNKREIQHNFKDITPSKLPEAIAEYVKKIDAEYQEALNESYAQLSDTTFKALRRALPVTRNKIDW